LDANRDVQSALGLLVAIPTRRDFALDALDLPAGAGSSSGILDFCSGRATSFLRELKEDIGRIESYG
jgi:hypothetical protein